MSSRGPYRRHSAQFKLQLCHDIRSGTLGRRDAQRKYTLSANLIQMWLTQFDRGELSNEDAEASVVADYEAKIAALERKVGQLTMELELVKKTPRLRLVNHQRIARLMKLHGVGIKPRRRFVRITDSDHEASISPKLYRRVIRAARISCGWRTSRISASQPGSAIWQGSMMPAAARSRAVRSRCSGPTRRSDK